LALAGNLHLDARHNSFAFPGFAAQTRRVTLPLALVFYEDLIPGSQLVNRLQDSQYRVQAVSKLDELTAGAASAGPMLIFADLVSKQGDVCGIIRKLRSDSATAHIPIIGFADDAEEGLQAAGREAGATLVAADSVILTHLTQFIERALQIE
jgi:CheY-like chemotaxis protein